MTPTSATLLYPIINNSLENIILTDVIPHIVRDHDLITLTASIVKPKRFPVVKIFHDLKDYGHDTLCLHVLDEIQDFKKITTTGNINEKTDFLISVITHSLEKRKNALPSYIEK